MNQVIDFIEIYVTCRRFAFGFEVSENAGLEGLNHWHDVAHICLNRIPNKNKNDSDSPRSAAVGTRGNEPWGSQQWMVWHTEPTVFLCLFGCQVSQA